MGDVHPQVEHGVGKRSAPAKTPCWPDAQHVHGDQKKTSAPMDEGLELIEIAPGIDLEREVLGLMGFTPLIRNLATMPPHVFAPARG